MNDPFALNWALVEVWLPDIICRLIMHAMCLLEPINSRASSPELYLPSTCSVLCIITMSCPWDKHACRHHETEKWRCTVGGWLHIADLADLLRRKLLPKYFGWFHFALVHLFVFLGGFLGLILSRAYFAEIACTRVGLGVNKYSWQVRVYSRQSTSFRHPGALLRCLSLTDDA